MDKKSEKLYRELCQEYGECNVFTTQEVQELFEIDGFQAPFVHVTRKSDNKRGWMSFTHYPRFYYDFR